MSIPIMAHDHWFNSEDQEEHERSYGVSGRIILSALICLVSVVLFVIFLHLYIRFVVRRRARRQMAARQRSMDFAVASAARSQEPPKTGLDAAVVTSLPTFIYKREMTSIECTVCLCGLEDDEMARLLPNCNHAFHVQCIDMWLHSHSTCPVCRTAAEPRVIRSGTPVGASAPPLDALDNPAGLEERLETDAESSLKPSGSGSGSRMNSFRRILSRERSERRLQACVQPITVDDLERQ